MRNRKSSFGLGLGLLLGAAISLSVSREARAYTSRDSFLETIGICIAGGTVLGASTLPYYDQPGKHLVNLAYGAGAGAAIGLGLGIAGLFGGSDEAEEASLVQPTGREFADFKSTKKNKLNSKGSRQLQLASAIPPSTLIWTPIVSLTW